MYSSIRKKNKPAASSKSGIPFQNAASIPDSSLSTSLRQLEDLRARGEALLPVKITPHYRKLIDSELAQLGETGGPLYRVAYPQPERFNTFAAGETKNFVMDTEHMPTGLENALIHRYPEKALFLATSTCLGHCQYCFRPDIAGGNGDTEPVRNSPNLSSPVFEKVCDYLREHPRIQEVIISGGDPLVCSLDQLEQAIKTLLSVPSVKFCRLHTRAPAYMPEILTDRLISILEKYDIRMITHLIHPYELNEETMAPLKRMRRRGIKVYNQFPLIRGINDHPAVIMELGYQCAEAGVEMLSLFIADPIKYSAVYRLHLQRIFDIADELFFNTESWLSNVRVCLDTPIGKVKREHITSYDQARNQFTFTRQGRSVIYQDIPPSLDQPASLDKLLYKGTRYVDLSQWTKKS